MRSRPARAPRGRKLGRGVLGLGVIGAIFLLFFHLGGGSIGGALSEGRQLIEDATGSGDDGRAGAEAEAAENGAEAARCELRLDSKGLELAGAPADMEEAVRVCEDKGEAVLRVTGDARYGEFEDLQNALEGAGVETYVR